MACWKDEKGYERVYEGQGFREMNDLGDTILELALTFDLVITKAFFKKRGEFNYL
jgi:hypothetical protein